MSLSKEWTDRLRLYQQELERQLFLPATELSFEGFTTHDRLRYPQAAAHPRTPMPEGTVYGEKFGYAWFFSTLTLPPETAGKKLVLSFDLGGEGLVYVDGVPFGTNRADRMTHTYHHCCDLVLTESAEVGKTYEIAFEGYAGDGPRKVLTGPVVDEAEFLTREDYHYSRPVVGRSFCGIWDEDAYQLFLDMENLVGVQDCLDPDSLRVMEIDNALKRAVNALRMEEGRDAMAHSYQEARDILAPMLSCTNGTTAPPDLRLRPLSFGPGLAVDPGGDRPQVRPHLLHPAPKCR